MRYTIYEEEHHSNPICLKIRLNCTRVDFTFEFGKSCWYSDSSSNINKLYGIEYGIFGIHKNSMRIGWLPDFENKGRIKIFYYGYENNSEHVTKYLMTVDVEKQYNLDVFLHGKLNEPTKLCIELNGSIILYDEECKIKNKFFGCICKPYFGGENTAPKDMYIDIN